MSADELGDLCEMFIGAFDGDMTTDGRVLRPAVDAVRRAMNHRWLEMLPPGSLMCDCGDIVQTEHRCDNCRTAAWAAGDGDIDDIDDPDAQIIRARALLAAASWLPVTDGEDELLATAERFAHWIESGERTA